jgi:hypothetical protein
LRVFAFKHSQIGNVNKESMQEGELAEKAQHVVGIREKK